MGCGHSKINIYPKRNRSKNVSAKKTVTPEKAADGVDGDEADGGAVEAADDAAAAAAGDDADRRTIVKVKPYGGPLIAHSELSASQNNFFKMLDERIENGPDYDSSSENEMALERERVTTLLRDWETASAGSRSLPATPQRRRACRPATVQRHAYASPPPPPPLQYHALGSLYGRQQAAAAALLGSSPVRSSAASPKHIPSHQPQRLSNGELVQRQLYHHHHHQQQHQQPLHYHHQQQRRQGANGRSYQSSVHIPIVQNDVAPYDRT